MFKRNHGTIKATTATVQKAPFLDYLEMCACDTIWKKL